MKRHKPMKAVLFVLTVILLCTASFLAGRYYENQKNETKADAVVNDAPDAASTGDTASTADSGSTADTGETASDVVNSDTENSNVNSSDNTSVTYQNTQYGFDFTLPVSWEGYTIQTEAWQGYDCSGGDQQGQIVETGIKISIRHPEWTKESPRQDIPIMVFTYSQWEKVEKEELSVSAAPIGPTKLGSNSKYVFALPARYNYAFPTGYEEVEDIIANNPLVPNEDFE